MAPPQLPPELVADIIELTVELLIEEERHLEAHEPLTNEFLLSAALVDHTWHSIAVEVLLKSGIVTSGSVLGFLRQVKAHGMEATLASVRYGEASSRGVAAEDPAWENAAFDLLVRRLPGINSVELIQAGYLFKTPLAARRMSLAPDTSTSSTRADPAEDTSAVQRVRLTNVDLSKSGFGLKFPNTPLAHLFISETRTSTFIEDGADRAPLVAFANVFTFSESIKVITNQSTSNFYLHLIMTIGEPALQLHPRLRSCHFECTSQQSYHRVLGHIEQVIKIEPSKVFTYLHLKHLATHLRVAHILLIRGTQPTFKSLDILQDPPSLPDLTLNYDPERLLVELINALPVLEKLRVPACWASDAVREACEVQGVQLVSA